MSSRTKIVLALDGLSVEEATRLTKEVGDRCYAVKIHDLFDAEGESIVRHLTMLGAKVWVDAKLHDIPKTAAKRAATIVWRGARIITVHASGGVEMMKAVVDRLNTGYGLVPSVWAVTVLTSLGPQEIARIHGADRMPKQIVLDFALMAKEAGVQGVICSPQEVGMLSKHPDLRGVELITPGVRSLGASIGDQKRTGTPKQAIDDGASFIVVGSQVTEAKDPVAAFNAIAAEIGTNAQSADTRKTCSQNIALH